MEHKFDYEWNLKEAIFTKDKGKVFSCFACGGGSTMGYKLAGFDVIGCNEIDKRIINIYQENHHPKYAFCESIQTFKNRKDLPEELFNLDILDGSPPCSTFSMAGNREDDWGKEKHFREGQAKQVLDTLFFDFIDLAKKLQPKVVVAENVKGLLIGNAIKYVRKIYDEFDKAGYYCQHFLLNSAYMGVPQRRERVFFICLRKDLASPFLEHFNLFNEKPKINMEFNEKPILFGEIADYNGKALTDFQRELWELKQDGDKSPAEIIMRRDNKLSCFNLLYVKTDSIFPCFCSKGETNYILWDKPIYVSKTESIKIQSFPLDYNFCGHPEGFILGMSVPPIMMAQISNRIYEQWLSKIK